MEKLNIICIDDQREVLSTLVKDLKPIADVIAVEECESADEAMELIEEIDAAGDYVALIVSDHVMPGKNGVEFLTEVNKDDRFVHTRKVLLTGLATQKDTIKAINNAGINSYFEKPWDREELIDAIKKLLTAYMVDRGVSYEKYKPLVDHATLIHEMNSKLH